MYLENGIVENLSPRAVLAYVAAGLRGPGEYTTADLAFRVDTQTATMREGLEELAEKYPEIVQKVKDRKWRTGPKGDPTALQILEPVTSRRRQLLDTLKAYWEWANPGTPFTMDSLDGLAINRALKRYKNWEDAALLNAIRNRAKSDVNHSQPVHVWLGRLGEYAMTPLDKYGKPKLHGGGKIGDAIQTEAGNRAARQAALAAR